MGYRVSLIVTRASLKDLIKGFKLETAAKTERAPLGEALWAATLDNGYSILWAEDEGFGLDNETTMVGFSWLHGPIYDMVINETVMAATLIAYDDGALKWEIHGQSDGDPENNPLIANGELPPCFEEIRSSQAALGRRDPEHDWVFEIPIEVGNAIFGFRYHEDIERRVTSPFHVLRPRDPSRPGWLLGLLGRFLK